MYELIYTSIATKDYSTEELLHMLQSFRSYNSTKKIGGVLVYHEREFIQLLEGNKEDLLLLYQDIAEDIRHTSVKIFHQAEINQRSFPNWSMGFVDSNLPDNKNISGFIDILKNGLTALEKKPKKSVGSHLFVSLCSTLNFDVNGTMLK